MIVKKISSLVCYASFFLTFIASLASQDQIVFYMDIFFPENLVNVPALIFFYKGNSYTIKPNSQGSSLKKSTFEFYEKEYLSDVYFFVSESPQKPTSLEIDTLKTSPIYSYRLWHLTAQPLQAMTSDKITKGEKAGLYFEWKVEELDNSIPCRAIPDNTIIFCWDTPKDLELRSSVSDNLQPFRMLPTVIFKNNLDEKTLEERAEKSANMALDLKFLHTKIIPMRQFNPTTRTLVFLPAPSNKYIS